METPNMDLLSEVERELRGRFDKEKASRHRLPSTAGASLSSNRIDSLVLPDNMRPAMPLTKDKYIVKENPHLVQWERETRKFLRQLSPIHGHRVSAIMVYEWATGIRIADVMKDPTPFRPGKQNWRSDVRKITAILTFYFGKPYMTWIAGHKVPRAFRVRPGYYITRHRPQTLTLWTEYIEGSLYP